MKAAKITLVVLVTLLTLGVGTASYAFHEGGVAYCGGCHSMHNAPTAGIGPLLKGLDQSSTCLGCHANTGSTPSSYKSMTYPAPAAGTPPGQMSPGGDFGWLLKTYTWPGRSSTSPPNTELGQTHGHNVVATAYGVSVDTTSVTSPGGGYPASQLNCVSCHDPHGKYRRMGGDTTYTVGTTGAPIIGSGSYDTSDIPTAAQAVGSYRLLAGTGYQAGSIPFPGIPVAIAPATYNRTESASQTRVAYGKGTIAGTTSWGAWCGTCHAKMDSNSHTHAVDVALGGTIQGNYNTYVSSGIVNASGASTSFLSLVPFIEATGDVATLKTHAKNDGTYLAGPASTDEVSCLTCHRAHASGWMNALRWNGDAEFLTYVDGSGNAVWLGSDSTPGEASIARGRLAVETARAYYDRPATTFGAYQRSLCNKCHMND